jgi:hypothetical protein
MAKRSLQHPIFETSWIDAEVVLDRSLATGDARKRAKLSRRPICTRPHLAAIYIRNLRIRHPQVTS